MRANRKTVSVRRSFGRGKAPSIGRCLDCPSCCGCCQALIDMLIVPGVVLKEKTV